MTNDGRFSGYVESAALTGDAVIGLGEDSIVIDGAGGSLVIPFADMEYFQVQNYRLLINTETASVIISRMGRDTDVLFELLWEAFNARTLKAFFVQTPPLFEAQGEYRYSDDAGQAAGVAKIKLFDNCLCILPPDSRGRRIPLCFMEAPQMTNFYIKMTLDTGEWYEVIRLGDRTKRLFELINAGIEKIRDDTAAMARGIDGTLTAKQAGELARLIPEGAAAAKSALHAIAPSFVAAAEGRIAQSRAADTYLYFKEICPSDNVYAGIKTGLSWTEQDAGIIWVTAVRKKDAGGVAAVELALGEEDSAATYIYKFNGDSAAFFKRLNHAMEAVGFHREVISMPDDDLKRKENALYAMAVKRTGALRFLRSCFAGRAIHRTQESWKKSIDEWMR